MAIDFPSGPANNDIYVDPITGNRYIWNSVFAYWAAASSTGDSATVGGNTASDLNTYADNKAANAYSNAVSYTDTKIGTANSAITSNAATAYSNAVSYTDSRIIDSVTNTSIAYAASANSVKNAYDRAIDANTRAASAQSAASAAYSNAVSYTDTKISTANTAMVANAATAYSNAVAYTDTKIGTANTAMVANASTAYTNAVAYVDSKSFVNTTQLSSNLSNYAALSGASFTGAVIVSNNLTVTGNLTLSGNTLIVGANNLVVSDAIISLHTPANLASLTSNDGKNIGLAFHYYDTEDKHALLYRDNSTGRLQYHNDGGDPLTNSNPTGNNLGIIQANSFWSGNNSVFATTNSTIYTGTANNANNLGGVAAANYVRKDQNNDIVENIRIRFGSANQTDVNDGTIAAGLFSNGLNIVGTQTQAGTGRQISYYGTLIDRANAGASFAGAVTLAGLSANGSLGTAGHTLHSNGSSTYWAVDDQGVTSVATGNGMTGGTITSTGTVSVLANTGIVANATGLFVNATYIGTLSSNSATFANSSVTNTFTVGTASYFVANGNLGIGTSTPTGKLTVEGNNIFLNATDASPRIEIFNRGTNTTTRFPAFTVTHYTGNSTGGDTGGQPVIELNRFRGSVGSLLPVQSGDILGGYNTWGSNSTASLSATRIQGIAEAAFTTTATAGLQFFTTSAGTQSEKVRITASGNVGIGNTTPNNRLTVQKAAGQSVEGELYLTEGTYWTQFNSRSSAGAYNPLVQAGDHSIIYTDGAANTGGLVIGPWAADARGIRIAPSGNVGIGTSSPSKPLSIQSSANDPVIITNSSNTNWNRIIYLKGNRTWTMGQDDGTSFVLADESAGAYRILVDSNGNVGIGNSSPNARLQVTGTANVSGNVAFGGTVSKTDVEDRYISNTTASTTQTAIDSFSATTYRSAKYIIQATNSTSYHYTEVAIVHDGTTAYATEFATMFTGASLVSFAVDINTGNVRLLATATNATTTTYKIDRKLIKV